MKFALHIGSSTNTQNSGLTRIISTILERDLKHFLKCQLFLIARRSVNSNLETRKMLQRKFRAKNTSPTVYDVKMCPQK